MLYVYLYVQYWLEKKRHWLHRTEALPIDLSANGFLYSGKSFIHIFSFFKRHRRKSILRGCWSKSDTISFLLCTSFSSFSATRIFPKKCVLNYEKIENVYIAFQSDSIVRKNDFPTENSNSIFFLYPIMNQQRKNGYFKKKKNVTRHFTIRQIQYSGVEEKFVWGSIKSNISQSNYVCSFQIFFFSGKYRFFLCHGVTHNPSKNLYVLTYNFFSVFIKVELICEKLP